jgi:hypothetical protein
MRLGAFFALAITFTSYLSGVAVRADESVAKKINGAFPKSTMTAAGSGSGVVIGPRHVLTNRHVALDDEEGIARGFKIRIAPEYKTGPTRASFGWASNTTSPCWKPMPILPPTRSSF